MSDNLLVGLPLLAAAVNTFFAVYATRFRTLPAARSFAVALYLLALWSLCYGLEVAAPDLETKLFWLRLRSPAFLLGPVWFVMCLQLAGRDRWLRGWHVAALCVIPLATAVLAAMGDPVGLVRTNYHLLLSADEPLLLWSSGPVMVIFFIYVHVLLFVALAVTLQFMRIAQAAACRQALLIVIGTVAVVVADLLSMPGHALIPGYHLGPATFLFTGVLAWLSLFHYGLFSIVPIARSLIVDSIQALVFVLDTEHHIAFANQAALTALDTNAAAVIGQPTTVVLSEFADLVTEFYDKESVNAVIYPRGKVTGMVFNLVISPLRDRRGLVLGRLAMLHDITELKQAQQAAEAALASARTLRGLLPICSSCKSIRDDQGYWQAVEQYVADHTDAEFSHGMCPDCMKKMYPEQYGRILAVREAKRVQLAEAPPPAALGSETPAP